MEERRGGKTVQDSELREKPKDLVRQGKAIDWWARKGGMEKLVPACWRPLEFTGPLIHHPN